MPFPKVNRNALSLLRSSQIGNTDDDDELKSAEREIVQKFFTAKIAKRIRFEDNL